ncbi:MAG TPA: ACT domain-containing protein [Anaerolineales bacterium]|nr:ACT domain-containing protein [Anaerolineales bacterium]
MTIPTLRALEGTYTIHRLPPGTTIPVSVFTSPFYSITSTHEELSIVVREELLGEGIRSDPGWSVIKVNGPLDLGMIGVMAGLSEALAKAGVSLFAISTFDTDYLLVKAGSLDQARSALEARGYQFD